MPLCKPKKGEPCLRYDKDSPDALISFVKMNGGPVPTFHKDGKAIVITLKNGVEKPVFVLPGSWLRSVEMSKFSAHSDDYFRAHYELVSDKPGGCGKVCEGAGKQPLHEKAFANILDKA